MIDFNQLQQSWQAQSSARSPLSPETILTKARATQKKMVRDTRITIVVLSFTLITLIAYFFWIGWFAVNPFTIGLGLMIGSMVWRIFLEAISKFKLNKLPLHLAHFDFRNGVVLYVKKRKFIHLTLTPIIYIVYTIGFSMITPYLFKYLSFPFFIYCIISGYGFLTFLAFMIRKKIKEELKELQFLLDATSNN
jgi:hypothetical protein